MTDAASHIVLLDSLTANEFAVELDGQRAPGIFGVQGLVTFKLDIRPAQTKLASETARILKAVQRDPGLPFNVWLRETLAAKDDIVRPHRTVAVVAIDDGVPIRRWTLHKCRITDVRYSDFDSAKSDLVTEIITIEFDHVEVTFLTDQAGELPAAPQS
jgi:hypothetical protein